MSFLVLQSESWLLYFVLLVSFYFYCSVALPHGAVCLSAVCDCGISLTYFFGSSTQTRISNKHDLNGFV